MDMTTPMQPKPLVDATCKLGEKGCFKDGRCHALGNCENKIVTNADHIRSMTDEELAVFIADKIPHGDCCDCYLECAVFDDSKFNNCCHNAFYKWLKQPYGGE